MIASLPVNNIAMVKIIKSSGLIGDAVAIYTMKGDMKPKTLKMKLKEQLIHHQRL
jgi:hypothetical protein